MRIIPNISWFIPKMVFGFIILILDAGVLKAFEPTYAKRQIIQNIGTDVLGHLMQFDLVDDAAGALMDNNASPVNSNEIAPQTHASDDNKASYDRVMMFDLFRNHGSMMMLFEPESGTILDANYAAYNFYGYADLIGRTIFDINTLPIEQVKEENAQAIMLEQNYFEFSHLLANRDVREVEVYSYPIEIENNQVLFSIINDVTEKNAALHVAHRYNRYLLYSALSGAAILFILVIFLIRYIIMSRKMAGELKINEGRYRELFDGVQDLIIVCDSTGKIIKVNKTAMDVMGQSDLAGRSIREFVSHETLSKIWRNFARQIRSGNNSFDMELQVTNHKDEIIFLDAKGYIKYGQDGKALEVFSIARDINIQKEMNRKILQSVINTEERERHRVAAELHDGLGPLLSGIKMYLQQDSLTENLSHRQIKLLAYSRQLVDDAIDQVRSIAYNITPAIINEFGLEKALITFINKVGSLGNYEINFKISPGVEKIDSNLSLAVYRIATELINNALKHANCNELTINIEIVKNTIILFYSDDGNSFNVSEVLNRKGNNGMGIANIFNRVKILNGQIEFDRNKSGRGMYACIRFPLQEFD